MSSKLDQSLEEIQTAQRKSAGARRRSGLRAKGAAPAPVGGISKAAKNPRAAGNKATAAGKGAITGDSKIIVSGLPKDVTEQQIKEYFSQSVGHIKRVELVYGPNSQSRGIANIIFGRPDGAGTAFQKLNGLLVDNRPIKIEIVVGAAQADKVMPTVKSLADRATHPKSQPKSATVGKKGVAGKAAPANAKAAPAAAGGKKGGRRAKNARPAKKTQEELDSEMADYFTPGEAAAAPAGGAAPAAGDAAMQDEIM